MDLRSFFRNLGKARLGHREALFLRAAGTAIRGEAKDATAFFIEHQLRFPGVMVQNARIDNNGKRAVVVGEITDHDQGPMNDYVLPTIFVQVLGEPDGYVHTETFTDWKTACARALEIRNDGATVISKIDGRLPYSQITAGIKAGWLEHTVPEVAKVSQ